MKDPSQKSEMETLIGATHNKDVEALDKYEKENIADDQDRQLLTAERTALAEYNGLRAKVVQLAREDKGDQARDLMLANQVLLVRLNEAFDAHRHYMGQLGQDNAAAA